MQEMMILDGDKKIADFSLWFSGEKKLFECILHVNDEMTLFQLPFYPPMRVNQKLHLPVFSSLCEEAFLCKKNVCRHKKKETCNRKKKHIH